MQRSQWGRGGQVAAVTAACLVLVACGGGSSGGSSTTGETSVEAASVVTPASGCGSLPVPAVEDPDGVVAALPVLQRESFGGYAGSVRRSPWANWKPDHDPPYTVGVAWQPLVNDFQIKNLEALTAGLKADPSIGKVVTVTTGGLEDVPQQIQQINSLIDQKVDLLIVQAIAPDALVAQSLKAGEAGIPMIEVQGTVPEIHSVNIQSNNYLSAGQSAARMLQLLGGKASLLLVHGIEGLTTDNESFDAFNAAIEQCPGARVAGEITGFFQTATAKGETIKFLATHPQPVDGVLQIGGMSSGVMQAFQQTGRQMPIVADIAAQKGSLGYWINNESTYEGVGTGLGPGWLGDAAANVARRMLAGQGLKTTVIIDRLPLIKRENLDQWADRSWNLTTPGLADGPATQTFLTDSYLDGFFERGAAPE